MSRGSYISRSLEQLPRTLQTTVTFCQTLVIAHCGPTPMTCGSCLCSEHITNSVIGVSQMPVLDCGTTFHLDYGGRDWPMTPKDNLLNLIYLATKVLSDYWIYRRYTNKTYLSIYLSNVLWHLTQSAVPLWWRSASWMPRCRIHRVRRCMLHATKQTTNMENV